MSPKAPTHNGITLGRGSPLLTLEQAKRKLQPREEDIQIAAMATLVGPALPGLPRNPLAGMIPKHPELMLLFAIPNGGARHKKTAGRMKAQGVLKATPDLNLPVARGPFIGLWIELKRPGEKPTEAQREMHRRLRGEGHAVVVNFSVEEVVAAVLGYLSLGRDAEPPGEAAYRFRLNCELGDVSASVAPSEGTANAE